LVGEYASSRCRALTDGIHLVTVDVSDKAGNAATQATRNTLSSTALMMSSPDMVLMLMVGAVVSMVNSLLLSTALLPAASGITV
jgi:hypothetical protein